MPDLRSVTTDVKGLDVQPIREIVEAWVTTAKFNREFNQRDMRFFVEVWNDHTRQLIRACRPHRDPDWYQILKNAAHDALCICDGTWRNEMGYQRMVQVRAFMQPFERTEPEFWQGLVDLSIQAATMLTPGARIIADKIDRTDV